MCRVFPFHCYLFHLFCFRRRFGSCFICRNWIYSHCIRKFVYRVKLNWTVHNMQNDLFETGLSGYLHQCSFFTLVFFSLPPKKNKSIANANGNNSSDITLFCMRVWPYINDNYTYIAEIVVFSAHGAGVWFFSRINHSKKNHRICICYMEWAINSDKKYQFSLMKYD